MMHYKIEFSLNKKITGKFCQVQDVDPPEDWQTNPMFIGNIDVGRPIVNPITAIGILHKKAKLTDLISTVPIGFSPRLLISEKFNLLIKSFHPQHFDFFPCHLQQEEILYNYWLVNPSVFDLNVVDFSKSQVLLRKINATGGTDYIPVAISTTQDFITKQIAEKQKLNQLYIKHIILKDTIEKDFFSLNHVEGRIGYYASEKFKRECEESNITGIEFSPIDLSLNEWLAIRSNFYKGG